MDNYYTERKNYSKFTAQMARNVVKKKILDIKSRGARAADELIDDLINKAHKSPKSAASDGFARDVAVIIEKNRSKWRNFIIELSGRFEADRLAAIGVNLIYGGLLTSSVGESGWASTIHVEGANSDKLYEIISKGRNRGNFVWILTTKGGLSEDILKTCRYFPECAFILADSRVNYDNAALDSKNIAFLLKAGDQNGEKELLKRGIPYIFTGSTECSEKGRAETFSAMRSSLFSFLEAPRLPIVISDLAKSLDSMEYLLSNGKNRAVPHYFA